jgi:hypothetical protein
MGVRDDTEDVALLLSDGFVMFARPDEGVEVEVER